MMKQEFEELTGMNPSDQEWKDIEKVYMNCDRFNTKQEFAEFFEQQGMSGVHRELGIIEEIEKEKAAGGRHFVVALKTKFHMFEFRSTSIWECMEALDEAANTFSFDIDRSKAMIELVSLETGKTIRVENSKYVIMRCKGEV